MQLEQTRGKTVYRQHAKCVHAKADYVCVKCLGDIKKNSSYISMSVMTKEDDPIHVRLHLRCYFDEVGEKR